VGASPWQKLRACPSPSMLSIEGMQFDRSHLSPYFVTNAEKMLCELENPFILLHEKKLSGLQAILPEAVVQSGRPLLIVAEDAEGEALATLVVNKLRGLKMAAVRRRASAIARHARPPWRRHGRHGLLSNRRFQKTRGLRTPRPFSFC